MSFVSSVDLAPFVEFELACFHSVSHPSVRDESRLDEYETRCHYAYAAAVDLAQFRRAIWFATSGSSFVIPSPLGLHLWLRSALLPSRPAVCPRRAAPRRLYPRYISYDS